VNGKNVLLVGFDFAFFCPNVAKTICLGKHLPHGKVSTDQITNGQNKKKLGHWAKYCK
jgi:hypothetical protein